MKHQALTISCLAAFLLEVHAASRLPPGLGKVLLSQTVDCPNSTDPDCLPGTTWTRFKANFDDLPVNTPIDAYTNIIFHGFTVATPPLFQYHPFRNHLGPTTRPNFARASPANASTLPYVTSDPAQLAKIKTFDFGCFSYDANPYAPPENAVPVACNLTYQASVQGFRAPPAVLAFTPHGPFGDCLAAVNLTAMDSDFIADTHVFGAVSVDTLQRVILYIDTIDGTNYTVT